MTRILLLFMAAARFVSAADGVISGTVTDGSRPVPGAVVRIQATAVSATTDDRGEFSLRTAAAGPVALTGFASGYYIAGPVAARAGDTAVRITLRRHSTVDDSGYIWVSAFASAGSDSNCEKCHSDTRHRPPELPYDEWRLDAHGTSAQNRRFHSMYNGTDLSGVNQSPPTRFTFHKDYGQVPLPPAPGVPYYGPGLKLDFPSSAGNCAACHAPAAAVDAAYDTDPNTLSGVGRESVACDFCHKVWSVRLDPATGLPYPNTPGVLSFDYRRPHRGEQFFAGPYDDVAPGDDTYSTLQKQSQICAPCHIASFWGVSVYNSFGEWLASPYSDPVKGQTCQDCHMPHRGTTFAARADAGAHVRDPKTVFSHLMPGAADRGLLQNTASLVIEARQSGPLVHVKATVTNEKGGHHIPTDHPSRNILLVISAKTADRDLVLYSGPVVPAWGGTGSAPEDLAGKPGRGYAKILEELWTEVAPTAAYWNPTVLREDTRIPALGRDISEYDFLAPSGGGAVQIEARLLFRRAFRQLFQWKQWNDPDILMNRTVVTLPAVVPGPAPLAIVHGATKRIGTALAPDSIATVYGSGLQDARVAVRDQDGRQADARLLYVSAGQINLVLPPGLASGPAVLTVTRSGEPVAASELTIAPAAPGLFTAGGAETGPAAAMVVSVGPDGSQSSAPVSQCDAARSCVAVPITIHPSAAKTYLMLFGTGIRGASKTGVTVRIAGVPAAVLSAGPQSQFAGLDQVNVELPLSLAGRGEVPVDLSCDGLATNMVWIHVR